jgi:hypothetical protein
MRTHLYLSMTAALLLASFASVAAATQDQTLSVDLKSFKFPEGKQDLFGYNEGESKLFFYTNGTGTTTVKVPDDGEYEVVIKASCDSALNERAKFKLAIDSEAVGKETLLTSDDAKDYKFSAKLKKGDRKLAIEYTNDVYKEGEYDRNLYVHAVTLKKTK